MACPWPECRCAPQQAMIVHDADEIALYPCMGMFKVGHELISPKEHFNRTSLHIWLVLIQLTPTARDKRSGQGRRK
jgi:hypothetical protein